ncbi:MAG: hypothetical protein ACLVKN_21405 [Flavonifractor plautii]
MAIVVNGKKVAGVGLPGKDGAPGADGKDGAPGKSAYQAAKEKGYTGTEEEFNTALAGMQSAPFLPLSGGTVEGVLEIRSGIEFGYGSNSIELSPSSASRLELVANASGGSSGGSIGGTVELIGLSAPTASNSAANKQYVDEHAGSRVILGSYVGTGKTGKSNPNQITLAEPFKILCIYGMQRPDSYQSIDNSGNGDTSVIIPGSIIPTEYTSGFGFFYSSNSRDSYGKKSADGKTFSWYYDYTPSDAATVQLNLSQVVYHYYAIV